MEEPVVQTAYGPVRGVVRDGVNTFVGIPYGAPTGGKFRFKAPRPPEPWTPAHDATQSTIMPPSTLMPMATKGPFAEMAAEMARFQRPEPSEDALRVNIWSAGLDRSRKRPVIVSMPHYSAGAAIGNLHNLASVGDVVAVSFSHRGGISGHMYLSDIGGEDYAESGNAGTLDLVLALQWIRDNIEAFGGDPSRVLLYGCSGSGSEIAILSGVPAAAGLFQRALVSEGFMGWGIQPFLATMMAERILDRLGIGANELDKLHDLPVQQLHNAVAFPGDLAHALTAPIPFQSFWQFYPVTDGVVLPEDPYDRVSPACSAQVPLMLGYAKDSLNMINCSRPWVGRLDDVGLRILVKNHVGPEKVDAVLAAERRAAPNATPTQLAMAVINHRTFLQGWTGMAEKRLRGGATAPTYLYRFDYETDRWNGLWGAAHGGEFNFFLNNVDAGGYGSMFSNMYAHRPERHEVQKVLYESFIAFAATGDPSTGALGQWPGYDLKARSTMVFDAKCGVVEDPHPELREVYMDVDECAGPGDYRRALAYEGFAE
jgi:para-nitrobenzyl esterase